MNFRVELDMFRGPLDLLLYLVRKHEVDITEIPVAKITLQYLEHLTILERMDVNAVGDFIDMASHLIEIKSRMVLPRVEEEDESIEDPREELVSRLLEYKQFKDAASILDDCSRQWQQSAPRLANDLPARRIDPADQPIHEVELWDLVSSFGRVMRAHEMTQPSNIIYDETPIHVYMQRIHQHLIAHGKLAISETYEAGMHKSALIGTFLAVLELVRHHSVEAEQNDSNGEIWVRPGPNFHQDIDVTLLETDGYDQPPADQSPSV